MGRAQGCRTVQTNSRMDAEALFLGLVVGGLPGVSQGSRLGVVAAKDLPARLLDGVWGLSKPVPVGLAVEGQGCWSSVSLGLNLVFGGRQSLEGSCWRWWDPQHCMGSWIQLGAAVTVAVSSSLSLVPGCGGTLGRTRQGGGSHLLPMPLADSGSLYSQAGAKQEWLWDSPHHQGQWQQWAGTGGKWEGRGHANEHRREGWGLNVLDCFSHGVV